MAKKAKEQSEWRITEIRAKGKVLGRVMAATAEKAIEAAVKEFDVSPERAKRLVAQRLS
jgi:hypothetical protein